MATKIFCSRYVRDYFLSVKSSPYRKYEAAKLLARQFRNNPTAAEKSFWNIVRNKQVLGKRFLRQFIFEYEFNERTRFFVADFFCSESRLIVEIDGDIHDKRREYDQIRSEILQSQGLTILRFRNREVEDRSYVLRTLLEFFKEHPDK